MAIHHAIMLHQWKDGVAIGTSRRLGIVRHVRVRARLRAVADVGLIRSLRQAFNRLASFISHGLVCELGARVVGGDQRDDVLERGWLLVQIAV